MSIMYGRWLGALLLMAALCLHRSQAQEIRVNITSTLKGTVGDSLEIECSLYAISQDGTVVFDGDQSTIILRRNGAFYNIDRLTSNLTETRKTYILRDLVREDEGGPIVCAAAEHTSDEVFIELCYAPEITSDGEITVVEGSGETATLDFVIDANPPSDTNTISSSSTSSVPSSLSINENNTVVVSESVTRSDSGQYIFVSRNSIGESSAVFTLDVQFPVTFTSTVSEGFNCDASTTPITCASTPGRSGTLLCNFESSPDGTLTTTLNIADNSSVTVQGGIISINSAIQGNVGNYTCVATNVIQNQSNSVRREITFYVGEFPTAVISASAEVDNMNETVTIQWTYIQEDAVPLTGFSLRGRLFASTTPTIDITVGPEVRQHVLSLSEDMLEPDANYVITVRAVNLLGEGDARDVPFISPAMTTSPTSGKNRVESCLVLLLLLMLCIIVL